MGRLHTTRESGHPIIGSAEPGEDWSWCRADQIAFSGVKGQTETAAETPEAQTAFSGRTAWVRNLEALR